MILEGFAGPGGWSEGLAVHSATSVGVELDPWACRTTVAAGHPRIRADVATFPVPACDGIVLSPPCPTFSTAGSGEGRDELPFLHSFVEAWGKWGWRDPWKHHDWSDPRTPLVLEPLRWLEDGSPRWVMLEQVPAVLPLWEHMLSVIGWPGWAAVLCAADYGVPQTRRRAFLAAHRDRPVAPPEPTHCEGGGSTLFGELAPWVSMADALGWGMTERPGVTFCGGNGGVPDLAGGSGAREQIRAERDRGAWAVDRRQQSDGVPVRQVPMVEPAPTVIGIAGAKGVWVFREIQAHGAVRRLDQPAKTIPGAADNGNYRFEWCRERPATTVFGDPRLAPPGHRDREGGERQFDPDTVIRLTVEDALRLQSFRHDYPVQGPKSARFLQVGNAVPPLLAAAVAEVVLS